MSTLEKVLVLLQSNEPVITLLFAGVVAICTIFYVGLTLLLVQETSKMRRVHTEPRVDFTIRSSVRGFFDAWVTNIGNGPAYDIRFAFAPKSDSAATEAAIRRLQEFNFIKNGITYLSPSQKMEAYFANAYESNAKTWDVSFLVTVSYRTKRGPPQREEFNIDLSEQFGGSWIQDHNEIKEIGKGIGKIAANLEHLTKGRTTLRVEVTNLPAQENLNE